MNLDSNLYSCNYCIVSWIFRNFRERSFKVHIKFGSAHCELRNSLARCAQANSAASRQIEQYLFELTRRWTRITLYCWCVLFLIRCRFLLMFNTSYNLDSKKFSWIAQRSSALCCRWSSAFLLTYRVACQVWAANFNHINLPVLEILLLLFFFFFYFSLCTKCSRTCEMRIILHVCFIRKTMWLLCTTT